MAQVKIKTAPDVLTDEEIKRLSPLEAPDVLTDEQIHQGNADAPDIISDAEINKSPQRPNLPIEPPTVAGEFAKLLPGELMDTIKGTVKGAVAQKAYESAGAVKGASMGYLDPTQLLEKTPISGFDTPVNKAAAETTGQLVGMAAPITAIAKGVGMGMGSTEAFNAVRPWLQSLFKEAVAGGIFGATKKPQEGQSRVDNAVRDAGTFLVFGGGLLGVNRLFSKNILIPDAAKGDVTGKAMESWVDTYSKGGTKTDAARSFWKTFEDEAGKAVEAAKSGSGAPEGAVAVPGEKIPASEVQAPTRFSLALKQMLRPLRFPNIEGGPQAVDTSAIPAAEANPPETATNLSPQGSSYLNSEFPVLHEAIKATPQVTPEIITQAVAAGIEAKMAGANGSQAETAAVKALKEGAAAITKAPKPIEANVTDLPSFQAAIKEAFPKLDDKQVQTMTDMVKKNAVIWSMNTGQPVENVIQRMFHSIVKGETSATPANLAMAQEDLFAVQKQSVNDRYKRYSDEGKAAGLEGSALHKYALDRLASERRSQLPTDRPQETQLKFMGEGGVKGFGSDVPELFQDEHTVNRLAEDLAQSRDSKEINQKLDSLFGTEAENAKIDAGEAPDNIQHRLAARFRADLEHSAGIGDVQETSRTLNRMMEVARQAGKIEPPKDLGERPSAKFIGYQEDGEGGAFPIFNVEGNHKLNGSTVSEVTLKLHGIPMPPHPSLEEWQKSEEGKLYQEEKNNTPFFSQLERVIQEKMPNRASAEQIKGIIGQGVKQEEIEWSGLNEWLAQQKGPIEKKAVMDFLKSNDVQVKEVIKGAPKKIDKLPEDVTVRKDEKTGEWFMDIKNEFPAPDEKKVVSTYLNRGRIGTFEEQKAAALEQALEVYNHQLADLAPTKFHSYQLPGGENYRELLMTLPNMGYRPSREELEKESMKIWNEKFDDLPPRKQSTVVDALMSFNKQDFRSSHFDEPNILAHVRFNDRTDTNGKKVLFIEEVQSDWHQMGRSKGYRRTLTEAEQEQVKKLNEQLDAIDTEIKQSPVVSNELRVKRAALQATLAKFSDAGLVPDAPFKKTWHELAMKRMLRYAVENGYDKIAWTTGEQQADRYDLSKQIESLDFHKFTYEGKPWVEITANDYEAGEELLNKKMPLSELPSVVGKDIASKINDSKDDRGALSGMDLKVGGEGLKGFYDKILPDFMNKYTKKWGGRVGTTKIGDTAEIDISGEPISGPSEIVHSLDITPSMKESVMNGQPLFQKGGIKKASVEFMEDGRAIIRAFEKADFSSLVHEIGHVFRREMYRRLKEYSGDALDQLKKDVATAEKFAGAKGVKWGRTAEEKFARSFERYLITGKAPSYELQRYYDMFRDWMKQVYGSVKGTAVDVKLSPEIRAVFDRFFDDGYEHFENGEKVKKSEIVKRAQEMADQAHEIRVDESALERFFRENPVKVSKADQADYGDIPVRFLDKRGRGLDVRAEDAKTEGLIPADVDAEKYAYEFLTGLPERGALSRASMYYDDALRQYAYEKEAANLFQEAEPEIPKKYLFEGMDRWVDDATNTTRHVPEIMKEALLSPDGKFKDLSLGEAGELSTLAPIRAAEVMDGKRFGLMKDYFLRPIQNADKAFHLELAQKQAKAKEMFKGFSSKDKEALFDAIDKGTIPPTKKIYDTMQWMKQEYDDLLARLNRERAAIGKDPIQKRQNYITHYRELSAIQDILQMIGMNMTEVPNSMLTISMYTKPNSPYFKYAKRRLGDLSDRDAEKAYGLYLEPALRSIHFSRATKNARDILEYKVKIPSEYEGGKIDSMSLFGLRYPNAYKYFSTYLNTLMGKRPMLDKMFPGIAAWAGLSSKLFSAGSIGGNLSSVITQFASFRNTVAETGLFSLAGQLLINTPQWHDFYQKNSRLGIGREYEPSTKNARLLGSKTLGKIHATAADVLSIPVGLFDREMVGGAFLSGYFKGKALGLSQEDAIRYGDDIAERTQASANIVDRPPVNTGKIKTALGQFQTFIYNEWSQLRKDMVSKVIHGEKSKQGYEDEGLGSIKDSRGAGFQRFLQYAIATAVMSATYNALGLPNPFTQEGATLPLIEKKNPLNVLWQHIINNIPGVSSVRYGGSPLLKGTYNFALYLVGDDRKRKEAAQNLRGLGARLVPAGGQLTKTIRAYNAMVPADGAWKRMRGLMFGPYYINNRTISKKKLKGGIEMPKVGIPKKGIKVGL